MVFKILASTEVPKTQASVTDPAAIDSQELSADFFSPPTTGFTPVVPSVTPAVGLAPSSGGTSVYTETEDDLDDDDNTKADLYNFILAYVKINPEPSDEQFQHLAESVNLQPEELDELLFEVIGIMARDDTMSPESRMLVQQALEASTVLATVEDPEEGEFDGVPDLGLDDLAELTKTDGERV